MVNTAEYKNALAKFEGYRAKMKYEKPAFKEIKDAISDISSVGPEGAELLKVYLKSPNATPLQLLACGDQITKHDGNSGLTAYVHAYIRGADLKSVKKRMLKYAKKKLDTLQGGDLQMAEVAFECIDVLNDHAKNSQKKKDELLKLSYHPYVESGGYYNPDTKSIDSIVTSLIVLGGVGTFFSLFPASKLAAIHTGQQLAPPLQDFTIYLFLVLLLGGLIYLAVRKFRKRISIPLSFK